MEPTALATTVVGATHHRAFVVVVAAVLRWSWCRRPLRPLTSRSYLTQHRWQVFLNLCPTPLIPGNRLRIQVNPVHIQDNQAATHNPHRSTHPRNASTGTRRFVHRSAAFGNQAIVQRNYTTEI
ncbi:uncharacterized protein LOC127834911 isoform X4 [Dreissena polymorpha]|uniref:uncharacterized protein LOC127834911 isoform X4 n=1 Tax=Dreissena polymorpha TaxID=45954 RepID=UPI002264CD56|nr:uncharacterized protein LOC127834911 isoform X4 [Dreissena polymorpha]